METQLIEDAYTGDMTKYERERDKVIRAYAKEHGLDVVDDRDEIINELNAPLMEEYEPQD